MAETTTTSRRYWWAEPKPQAGAMNIGETERWISGVFGGLLIVLGLRRRGFFGKLLTVGSGGLAIARAVSGHSFVYDRFGVSSAGLGKGNGITILKSVTVNRPIDEVYAYWRDFENLPKFIDHLDAVVLLGNGRSHWDMRGPNDIRVEWDAEIIDDRRNDLISWRSLQGSQVDQSGSVHFKPAPAGRGTEVRLKMRYVPPGGVAGFAVAKALAKITDQQVAEDLRRFKQLLEAGTVPTTAGQPHGGPKSETPREPAGVGAGTGTTGGTTGTPGYTRTSSGSWPLGGGAR